MNTRKKAVDQAIDAIRKEVLPAEAIAEASARVWSRLNLAPVVEKIRSCADVQALAGAYGEGQLAESRRLLIEDHLHACPACRHMYSSGGEVRPAAWSAPLRPLTSGGFSLRWASGAMALLLLGIATPWLWNRFSGGPEGSRLTVKSVDGLLLRVSDKGERRLQAGDELGEGELVRTAANSRAFVRLLDGSTVEIRDRAQLSVYAGPLDTTVKLDRGDIIVEAAKRRRGHLYVQAPDCRVAVTGTVFSVSRGLKGSRVSVVEGEVHVEQTGRDKLLHRGDQAVTTAYLQPTAVKDEIAWSRNVDQHLALLGELQGLQRRFEQIRMPTLRYESRLIALLPANTVVFASVPNLGSALGEAQQIFEERLQQSPALQQWWKHTGASGRLPQIVQQLRALSQYLGEEIVLTASLDAAGRIGEPLVLAQVVRPGLPQFLQENAPRELPITVEGDLVAFGPSSQRVQDLKLDSAAGFPSTAFGRRVLQSYQDGAGIILAADMGVLSRQSRQARGPAPLSFNDVFGNVQYLVIERKELSGQPQNRADVTFAGSRQGLASWLGSPGSMGTLQFVSPEANVVAAGIVKTPSAMLEDLLRMRDSAAESHESHLNALEQALHVRLREDVLAPLGTEFLFAMDGPLLPVPSWKLVAEVNDPGRLQQSIQTMVDTANDEMRKAGRPGLVLGSEQVSGRTYYSLRSLEQTAAEAHYTFVDGYLVAAPTSAMVTKAIQVRESGMTLARSERFLSLLPADRHMNFSALIYHNLGSLASPVLSELRGSQSLTPGQRRTIETVAAETKPSLVYAYGDQDRIQVASSRDFFGLDLRTLLLGSVISGKDRTNQTLHPYTKETR